MKKTAHYWIRKSHRYLGLIIGIQFLMWTIGGLYFSWTNLDDIHGDQFKEKHPPQEISAALFQKISKKNITIQAIELRFIGTDAYFWINKNDLMHAQTGVIKAEVTEAEALLIAQQKLRTDLQVESVERIEEVGPHHEYRERPLPAWAIHYKSADNVTAYVSIKDGSFQRVRHSAWRKFDFLWMLHTMDYSGRDNFNNWILRIFSVLGLVTILLGFSLFFISSNTLRRNRRF